MIYQSLIHTAAAAWAERGGDKKRKREQQGNEKGEETNQQGPKDSVCVSLGPLLTKSRRLQLRERKSFLCRGAVLHVLIQQNLTPCAGQGINHPLESRF